MRKSSPGAGSRRTRDFGYAHAFFRSLSFCLSSSVFYVHYMTGWQRGAASAGPGAWSATATRSQGVVLMCRNRAMKLHLTLLRSPARVCAFVHTGMSHTHITQTDIIWIRTCTQLYHVLQLCPAIKTYVDVSNRISH